MRRTTSIILLFLLLFQTAGALLLFKVQQHLIRKEIKNQIKSGVPEGELTLLKIPRQLETEPNRRFQRIHDREFRYDGQMYDIVRAEKYGEVTWYYCLSDEKETELFARLDEWVDREMNHDPERQKQTQTLERLLSSLFLVQSYRKPIPNNAKETVSTDDRFTLNTWTPDPSFPPPQV